MTELSWVTVAMSIVSIVVGIGTGVIGYLIKDLYAKHEADASKLTDLELLMERTRYTKTEIDVIYNRLTEYFDKRFDKLEEAIKK